MNAVQNSVFNADSMQASAKLSDVVISNEAISENGNQPSTEITISHAAPAKTKSWPETITGNNSIIGIDSKTGLWVFCKFCDKRVTSRAWQPFTIVRWAKHKQLKSHMYHEIMYYFTLR